VLWAGGYRVLNGHISLGGFVMFNTYMGMLIWPMIAMGWVVNLMQRGTASLSRIGAVLDEKPAIAAPPVLTVLGTVSGQIEFREVSVEYQTGRALDCIDLEIRAGETVAIVGHTGSGKSTLVKLIPRLLDPTAGAVLVDGIDVRALSPDELRRNMGLVPQETFLFSSTLAENIAFGVENATEERIRWAAEVAGLAGDVEAFPKGYQTVVGERGLTLSGGQKQRTSIARAIMRDPRILILDDALSSDPRPRGAPFVCLNATTGEVIWTVDGMYRSTRWGGRAVIGDSIMAAMDTYDMRIYAVGKGPSAITIDAPMTAITAGDSMVLRGTLTDISPGTNDEALAMRFPNGVPVVSDKSMSDWMLYVYKQFPKPLDATGVEVSIDALDPNNNLVHIGTATTDNAGSFSYLWQTPDIPGKYTIIATFPGSNSYYGSSANTAMGIVELPTTLQPSAQPLNASDPNLIYAAAAIIIAIIIVGIVLALIIRKRP
jgi:energy-coupling factor transporter ATP-binding protein EcfA2